MRPTIATLVLLTLFAGRPANAGEKSGEPGTNVEMPFLIAPVTDGGKLTSYAYISLKVVTTSRSAALGVRDKMPFIQDAFVRDVNATPIARSDDHLTVDQGALDARLTADVRRIVGAGEIVAVVVIRVQTASVHPIETPAQNVSATPPI